MLWQTNPFSGRLQVFTTNISLKTWSTMDNGNLKFEAEIQKTPLLSWKSQQMRWPLCNNFKSRDASPQNIYHQMTFWTVHTLTVSYLVWDSWYLTHKNLGSCENLLEKCKLLFNFNFSSQGRSGVIVHPILWILLLSGKWECGWDLFLSKGKKSKSPNFISTRSALWC